ncbi:2-oxoglutarate dehydrogenase E1 component [Pedobacter sp. SD-b]|uniref:oxoglutarate dehydrogenase (succinyl-transferring) n=1 Tax=Pedobacter segetis TaxID=2793069 RepID=A0ABS1BLI7_9SPHI|nr:2-oxoglutarate dehydrogenase E1 component [Pedobacter segetis]MBK0383171.1 2-oxoglutarate dehydrogenase E1 component [Pedobacter segetis]
MDSLSYLSNADSAYIDSLYQSYQQNPDSVDFGWQKFFEGFDFGQQSDKEASTGNTSSSSSDHVLKEINALNMINGYRDRGHLFTKTNPVRERRQYFPGKELETFGFTEADLDTVFKAGVEVGLGPNATLREIKQLLEDTYCQSLGIEYRYMRNPIKLKWFEDRMEKSRNKPDFDVETKKRILLKLNQAVAFESFLGTKFLGQKRFSLEGAEALIPALDSVIEKGAALGIQEFVIGMAHRGRLNVLANIMGKTYKDIFSEFEGKYNKDLPFGGDVKYHLGFSTDVETSNNQKVHLSLCPNPSHLETVSAVVEGITRSKMDLKYDSDYKKIAPILLHGDASIAGQGIVYEVLQMSKLDAYSTGGTIHLVINNQIGFTTNYKDARSSTYCTDIAKVTLSPVFHVNGDDVEELVYAINMAMEYRQRFHNDVFIDILCYRRYGHNESDEPRFTQPILYKTIENHPNPREIYVEKLLSSGTVDNNLAKQMEKEFKALLQERLNESKEDEGAPSNPAFSGAWTAMRFSKPEDFESSPNTAIDKETFLKLAKSISTLPKDKNFLSKIDRLFKERLKMAEETHVFDWAMGELVAYASVINDGKRVRMSGQDVERGTFSHRHAVVKVEDSEEEYTPLSNLAKDQAPFEIYNSHLSEYGVLGFEYGYAMANPNALTIWEAQFGDFFNGAQIILDQYISAAETKWQRANGLVMLLPHGYEGQGPEHSSARIERFLELCAEYNMQVINCTTPAQFFHALRRQLIREIRKPLVVFSPKSLLRFPKCVSPLKDFTDGKFQEVIDDENVKAVNVKRVLISFGKIYYDLLEEQEKSKRNDVAIVRLEQVYPTPYDQLEKIRKKYKNAEFVWVQEESENMGAWPFISRIFRKSDFNFDVISRKPSSSPATGFAKQHLAEQAAIVAKAFEIKNVEKVKEVIKKSAMAKTAKVD